MLQVETFMQNPEFEKGNYELERFLKASNISIVEKQQLIYGYIEIYDEGAKVFEGSLEVFPDYWFIILQLIEQFFNGGMGSYEFPTLLKFEAVDSETIRIVQNEETYSFLRKPLINALLEACTVFLQTSDKYIEYLHPIESIKSLYLGIIEKLYNQNNKF